MPDCHGLRARLLGRPSLTDESIREGLGPFDATERPFLVGPLDEHNEQGFGANIGENHHFIVTAHPNGEGLEAFRDKADWADLPSGLLRRNLQRGNCRPTICQ